MKLLIIEDDSSMAQTLKEGLQKEYVVELAYTGKEGAYLTEVNEYDLIIVDFVLPDISGIPLLALLRQAQPNTLILFLTGQSDIEKKVLSLDNGADDYVLKPCSMAELKARVRALLRRYPKRISSNIVSLGDLIVDLTNKKVTRGDTEITLRRKEFDLLEYFVRNSGKVLTRSMILDHVWDSSYDAFTNIVDVHINYLRARLDKPFPKKLIKTIHGLGYKLDV